MKQIQLSCCVPFLYTAEEDRRRGVRGNLRGVGPADSGECGVKSGVSSTAQTSPEDGGGSSEETAG